MESGSCPRHNNRIFSSNNISILDPFFQTGVAVELSWFGFIEIRGLVCEFQSMEWLTCSCGDMSELPAQSSLNEKEIPKMYIPAQWNEINVIVLACSVLSPVVKIVLWSWIYTLPKTISFSKVSPSIDWCHQNQTPQSNLPLNYCTLRFIVNLSIPQFPLISTYYQTIQLMPPSPRRSSSPLSP